VAFFAGFFAAAFFAAIVTSLVVQAAGDWKNLRNFVRGVSSAFLRLAQAPVVV
jgi:hypothetical protein